jgi:dsDNA-binding SOS-regulon protein
MKNITAFQTSDGRVFTEEVEAKKHEKFLEHKDVVEEFLQSSCNPYASAVQKSIARNTVTNWELWKNKNAK